ncbi:DUF4214 domain-containing protein [Massilia sp. MB5]|uniref:beta strand repeat-containing protein n=1 Tax=Massilia sp. MB5 TaxID=2919578 RepID=UPI001F110E78|nr:DUF4214 domain-containing protein [Massilia sp. MB5]UMR31011.1 DUF4214 domain-containing protein [Massilia sp. MB5]
MAAQEYVAVVQQLYISYFGRPADYYGLDNFTKELDKMGAPKTFVEVSAAVQGKTNAALVALVNGFNGSAESAALYGTENTQIGISKFVNAIYNNVLNRDADNEGRDFWVGEILSGRLTKANAATAITQGAISNTTTQGLIDAKTVANKLAVATDFTSALDTTAEINAFSGAAAAASARGLLAGVTNVTVPADYHVTVEAAVAQIVADSIPSTTFNLTTGVDTFPGSSGNDIINAFYNDTGATWSALDSIDGGAGKDTLNLSDVKGGVDLSIATVKNVETAVITSIGALANADVSGWTGLTSVTANIKAGAAQTIKAADTTAVTVTNNGGATVIGGSSVTVNATGSQFTAQKALQTAVAAAADMTAVGVLTAAAVAAGTITAAQKTAIDGAGTVGAAGTAAGTIATATDTQYTVNATNNNALVNASVKGATTVNITDGSANSDKLKSVSLDGSQNTATLTGKALTSVSIANQKADVTIVNAATGGHAATVSLNKVTGGVIKDDNATSLTVTSTGTKSSGVTLTAGATKSVAINAGVDLTVADVNVGQATTITASGAGKVTIAATTGVGSLTSIDGSANTGGVVVTPGLGNGVAFTGGTGADSVTIGATTKAIATGAGNDTVTITANVGTGGSIDAGAGVDTLAGTSVAIAALTGAPTAAAKYTNFETLKVTDALAGAATFDVSKISGVVNFTAGNSVTNGATANVIGLGAGANVAIEGTSVDAFAGTKEVFTMSGFAAEAATNTIIFDGVTYTVAVGGTADAAATVAAFVAAYNAAGAANWVAVGNVDNTVTFTKKAVGVTTDVVAGAITGTHSSVIVPATSTQGADLVAAVNGGTLAIAQAADTAADVINLKLNVNYTESNDSTATVTTVTSLVTAASIETINVTSTGKASADFDSTVVGNVADGLKNVLTLTDDALVTLKVSGDQAFSFTSAASMTKLATIDASALTAGATINASAGVAGSAAVTIKGSATAANTLTGAATADTIIGGSKADVITGGAGGDTLTGGGGNDTFKFAAGDSSIGTGTFDIITDFAGNTYGNGTSGAAGTGAGAAAKLTGDVLAFTHTNTALAANGFKVFVATTAADATTFLANTASASNQQASAALDSTTNKLYVDVSGDGVADFYVQLTGVTTITAAAFTLA